MENKIPTVEEQFKKFFDSFPRYGTYLAEDWKKEIKKLAVDYAKLHVKAALEAAAENVFLNRDAEGPIDINKESILSAYPENLII